jgi:hypothetical protein
MKFPGVLAKLLLLEEKNMTLTHLLLYALLNTKVVLGAVPDVGLIKIIVIILLAEAPRIVNRMYITGRGLFMHGLRGKPA